MKKVEKFEFDVVTTVLTDIMEGENDLFNNYIDYNITKIEQIQTLKQYEVELNFIEDQTVVLFINEHEDSDILEYDVDLSEVY